MNEEYERHISLAVRKLIRAVDEAALAHHRATGHMLAGRSAGWDCTECETSFVGELKVVGA